MSEDGISLVEWVEKTMKEQRELNPQIFKSIDIVKGCQKGIDVYNKYLEIMNIGWPIIISDRTF